MHPIDILFWSCLMLGAMYTLFTLLAGSIGHGGGHGSHVGHSLHLPHGAHHVGHVSAHVPAHHGAAAHHVGQRPGSSQAHHNTGGAQGEIEQPALWLTILQYLNPLAVAGFLLGFGTVGVMMRSLGFRALPAAAAGAVGGYGLWLVAYMIVTRFFGAAEGSSEFRCEDVVGVSGQVTVPIGGARPGMVAFTASGARQVVRAVAEDDEELPTGCHVRIRKIEDNTAYVARIE